MSLSVLSTPGISVDAHIQLHIKQYRHDYRETSQKCNKTGQRIEHCMRESIQCGPLERNTTCNMNISSPIDPIDPQIAGCTPSPCTIESIILTHLEKTPIERCKISTDSYGSDNEFDATARDDSSRQFFDGDRP